MNVRDCSSFFSGLGAGIAIALLFAPKSGSETRGQLHEKMTEGRRKFEDQVAEGRRKYEEKRDAAYHAYERQREGISAAFNAGKQAYQEAVGRV